MDKVGVQNELLPKNVHVLINNFATVIQSIPPIDLMMKGVKMTNIKLK